MASKTVEVLITGNASQAISEIERLAGTTAATSESMGSKFAAFGKGVALVGAAAAVAVAGFSIKMADEFEKSHARLVTALKASGQSFAQWQPQVDKTSQTMQKFGFNNSDVQNALSRLVPATHSAGQATRDLGIAADIAAKQHISLEDATNMLVKVEGGRYLALSKTLGVSKDVIASFKSQDDAIRYLSDHFKGQAAAAAETFGGKIKALGAEAQNLGIKIGQVLIPILEKLMTATMSVVDWFEKHKTVAEALGVIIGTVLVAAMTLWITSLIKAAAVNTIAMFSGMIEGAQVATLAVLANASALGALAIGAALVIAPLAALTYGLIHGNTWIDANSKALTGLAQGGMNDAVQKIQVLDRFVGSAAVTHKEFLDLLQKSPQQAGQFITAVGNSGEKTKWFKDQLAAYEQSSLNAATKTETLKTKLDLLSQGYTADTAAILANQQALDKSIDPQLNAQKAILATNSAIRDLAAAAFVSANGTSADAAANDDYTGKLITAKQAIESQTTAQLKAGESTKDVVAGLQNVASNLSPGSPLRVFIEGYIAQLQQTGGTHTATLDVNAGPAQAKIAALIGQLSQNGFTTGPGGVMPGSGVLVPAGTHPTFNLDGSFGGYKAAAGGYFPARAGGYMVNVGEGGEDEVVAPVSKLGGGTVNNITINVSGSLSEYEARRTAARLQDQLMKLTRTGG